MTDERIRELMKAKGFWQRPLSPTFLRVYRRLDACFVEPRPDGQWIVVVVRTCPQRKEWVTEKTEIPFTNPIAAATYAERHVIPALLAGKESA
jgi:hypothetical protein